MKKVLVTGVDGFIGSHLTEKLIAEGSEVMAFTYLEKPVCKTTMRKKLNT